MKARGVHEVCSKQAMVGYGCAWGTTSSGMLWVYMGYSMQW